VSKTSVQEPEAGLSQRCFDKCAFALVHGPTRSLLHRLTIGLAPYIGGAERKPGGNDTWDLGDERWGRPRRWWPLLGRPLRSRRFALPAHRNEVFQAVVTGLRFFAGRV